MSVMTTFQYQRTSEPRNSKSVWNQKGIQSVSNQNLKPTGYQLGFYLETAQCPQDAAPAPGWLAIHCSLHRGDGHEANGEYKCGNFSACEGRWNKERIFIIMCILNVDIYAMLRVPSFQVLVNPCQSLASLLHHFFSGPGLRGAICWGENRCIRISVTGPKNEKNKTHATQNMFESFDPGFLARMLLSP